MHVHTFNDYAGAQLLTGTTVATITAVVVVLVVVVATVTVSIVMVKRYKTTHMSSNLRNNSYLYILLQTYSIEPLINKNTATSPNLKMLHCMYH